MSASNPGRVRRFFRGLWRVLDTSRRVVLNLIFLAIVVFIVFGLIRSGTPAIADKTALVLRLDGTIGEQKSGNLRSTALDQVRGEAVQKIQLRDIVAVLDAAAADPKITGLVVVLDEMRPTGFSTLREVAAAIDRFKASGKKVVAWGSSYDQRQYYVAVHANEVYMHPLGMTYLSGFGSLRNYYKDALDKLGVTVNVMRVGTFKSAVEPFIEQLVAKLIEHEDAEPDQRERQQIGREQARGERVPAAERQARLVRLIPRIGIRRHRVSRLNRIADRRYGTCGAGA